MQRKLKVSRTAQPRKSKYCFSDIYVDVPTLTLSGKWLQKHFKVGDTVTVTSQPDGSLIISK